jgi:hypothetical protein
MTKFEETLAELKKLVQVQEGPTPKIGTIPFVELETDAEVIREVREHAEHIERSGQRSRMITGTTLLDAFVVE